MKKLTVFLVTVFITILVNAQTNSDILNNKERTVYWFEMSIKYAEPNDYAHVSFMLEETDNIIKKGTIEEFEKNVYNALKLNHVCIGYYNTKQETEEAKAMYLMFSNKGSEELDALEFTDDILKNYPDKLYWFLLHPFQGENQWYYVRKPGALTTGSKEDFFDFANENLLNRVLTIGPFIYGQTAEDSKRIFRLKNDDSYKKGIKYPFNFKGSWIAKQGDDKLVLDFKKSFKTKLTYRHTNKDSVFVSETYEIQVVHPYVITFYFSDISKSEILSIGLNYYCLFLSDDMKSANLKIYNAKSELIGEYDLIKE